MHRTTPIAHVNQHVEIRRNFWANANAIGG